MSDLTEEALRQAVEKAGLQLVDKGKGHFQITGGKVLVNYYPFSKYRTAYVDGSKAGVKLCDVRQAINLAGRNLEPEEMRPTMGLPPGWRHDGLAQVESGSAGGPPPWDVA